MNSQSFFTKQVIAGGILLAILFPLALFAQNSDPVADTGFNLDDVVSPEERARNAELQAKYDAGTISDAELAEYATLNSGNADLKQYLPVEPAPVEVDVNNARVNNTSNGEPAATEKTFVREDLYQAATDRNDDMYKLVLTLAAIVFINLLLTLYIMFRKRHV